MKYMKILCMLGIVSCVTMKSVYASDLIVCQNGLCSVVQPQINRTQYLNHIKSMLLTAPNGRIDFCEASSKTHLCQTNALRWKTLSDSNQFNMSIPNARINVTNGDISLDYTVEANNSYPRCMFSPLKLSILPNKNLQIISHVYNCNLLETEPTNIQKILTVDFIDLDHKVIGGSYLIQSGGALRGETKGYALMQLRDSKTSLPLVAQRYRNTTPSIPIPVIQQQTIPQYTITPLWNENKDAIFKDWAYQSNRYPPIVDTTTIEEFGDIDDMEEDFSDIEESDDEEIEEDLSLPPETLAPQQTTTGTNVSQPVSQKIAEPTSKPTQKQTEQKEIATKKQEPVQKEKPAPTVSSILDDLLYTLPFDWLDDSQNAENDQSLFEPTPKAEIKDDTPPEQPKAPEVIPIVPKEVILLVPQESAAASPIVIEKTQPTTPEPPAPVYVEPQQQESIEESVDISQKRQNIFITTPPKPQPKKSFWERISNAAVNMFYFEPII